MPRPTTIIPCPRCHSDVENWVEEVKLGRRSVATFEAASFRSCAAREQDDGITKAEVRDALLQIDSLSDQLFPAEQARIVELLVERVEIAEDGLDIQLRTDGLVREFGVEACPSLPRT